MNNPKANKQQQQQAWGYFFDVAQSDINATHNRKK
jgi:hypothetical protein